MSPQLDNNSSCPINASQLCVHCCRLLTESGEREKGLERKVEALTRENVELKAQVMHKENSVEVEGLLRQLVEKVGEVEACGAHRHDEVRMYTHQPSQVHD